MLWCAHRQEPTMAALWDAEQTSDWNRNKYYCQPIYDIGDHCGWIKISLQCIEAECEVEDQDFQQTWSSEISHTLNQQRGSIHWLLWGSQHINSKGLPGLASVKEDTPKTWETWCLGNGAIWRDVVYTCVWVHPLGGRAGGMWWGTVGGQKKEGDKD